MRLKNMLLITCAPFEHLELDFGDENINILSGINGAGKTTIISYIVDAFYELAKNGFSNEFESIHTKFYRISSGLFSVNSSKVSIVYLRFLQESGNIIDYVDIRGNCSKEEYDSFIHFSNKIEYSKIEKNLNKNDLVKYWTITEKKEIENLFSSNLLTYFPAYRYEAPYYLNDPYKVHLEFAKDFGFSGYLTNPIEVAGIDLQTGEAIPLVSDTHNSDDYIEFLQKLDEKYPKGDKIRLILDNLKVHSSQKVIEYLESNPGRFEFVFTPKHASWLNLIEGLFSKMTKQMLRGIRVSSKQELEDRIYKYFDEINAEPVVYHWGWNLDDVDPNEDVKVQTLVS